VSYLLYANEIIWRVVEILWSTEMEDGKTRHVTGRVEHRKTYDGAKKLRDRWAAEPNRSAVIQGGIVTWYFDDELQAAYDATDFTRTQNYDDRDEL
jgi:hypothetical protein